MVVILDALKYFYQKIKEECDCYDDETCLHFLKPLQKHFQIFPKYKS